MILTIRLAEFNHAAQMNWKTIAVIWILTYYAVKRMRKRRFIERSFFTKKLHHLSYLKPYLIDEWSQAILAIDPQPHTVIVTKLISCRRSQTCLVLSTLH